MQRRDDFMDMVNPSMEVLLKKVDSRYTLVVFAAKRARQILEGADVKVKVKSTKNVTNALEEIAEGKILYERTKIGIK
jgi:DNA-directed RNA polymerase subunit omega